MSGAYETSIIPSKSSRPYSQIATVGASKKSGPGRNLDRRVEIAFPVLEPRLQAQVREILEVQLQDTAKARVIGPDGRSQRIRPAGGGLRAQERLYERAGADLPPSL